MVDVYAADLETSGDENEVWAWYWGICNLYEPEKVYKGTDIASFIHWINTSDKIIYFHNLKFDGGYILDYLFRTGYKHVSKNSKYLEPGEMTTLISDMGQWYTITVRLWPNETGYDSLIEFIDSAKLITLPIEKIPSAFGLDETKGEIDYLKIRLPGYEPTPEEEDYLNHDVIILAKALNIMRDRGLHKLTTGACALHDYRTRLGAKAFNKLFPKLADGTDFDIRKSYKGGWTYLNPVYRDRYVEEGKVYDVNSMYPWAMKYCLLPYGPPVYFKGKYKEDPNYPLYVQSLSCEFHLKPGHFPSIQIKHNLMYSENEYLIDSVEPTLLTLTSVDLELFYFNYDVKYEEWHGGYMFRGQVGMFDEYIDYWYEQKTEAKKHKNGGQAQIAKLFLNSLYGKFGARREGRSKTPYWDPIEERVRYKIGNVEARKGGYLPVATFITSYCRDKINRGAYHCGKRFVYADTDSLHIIGLDPVEGLDVDEYRLGAFKEENVFKRGKFIRQKTYLEVFEGLSDTGELIEKLNIKCCGMPRKMQATVKESAFVSGAVFDASMDTTLAPKLMPKTVKGGVYLKPTTFQIKG